MKDWIIKRTEEYSNSFSKKQTKILMIILTISVPIMLLIPFLGWKKFDNFLISIWGLILIDVLGVFFAKHRMNFIVAIVLGGLIALLLDCLLFIYVGWVLKN
ncbi:hypothetical protein GCM10022297_14740 [Lactobacillus hamsteri]|uniref:Uncharacterized protein n=1 Tax=Lactobacillus hamsteri DSM 5661 = JCM 6256 TaxID=1423754 RepID=A0A0R1YC50_9LACO|nr:hypothetical protein [Lactobacillus hamsteri]KRM40104.1 hypothetical protein FC39_GL000839 [Lactobacillus hamsteri DSM 5661 = JCM 6256]